jgi:predicted transcriptional regulator
MSADNIARYRMTRASSIQISLNRLLSLGVVHREDDGRYTVVDSLMREWVARRTY